MSSQQERQAGLPRSWKWAEIRDIGQVLSGGTPSTKDRKNWGDEIAWISPSDLTGYSPKYIARGAKSLSRAGLSNSSARLMPPGSVIFSSRAPIGYVAITSREAATNQGFKSVVPAGGIYNEYIYYYLKASKSLAHERAAGTTFKEISGLAFGHLPIPVAPTNEQHRIVAKIDELFSEIDKAVENLTTAREQLKAYRQSVLKYAFEGKLTADWRTENTHKLQTVEQLLSHVERERSKKRSNRRNNTTEPKIPVPSATIIPSDTPDFLDLPLNWVCLRAEDLMEFITKGTTPTKELLFSSAGDIPFIKVYNLTKGGSLDFSIEPTFVEKSTHNGFLSRSKVFPGDVLMNIVGPPLGKVSIVPNTHPEWNVNQAIAIFRSKFISPRFLSAYLSWEKTVAVLINKSKATAGQFNLTLELCRDIPIPLCGADEQAEIETRLETLISQIDHLHETITKALADVKTTRQSVLQQAFTGQLVAQDPNDEPASVLLERIRAEKENSPPPERKKRAKGATA